MTTKEQNLLAIRAAKISVLAGIFISLLKFAGYYSTASFAIFSDALESLINILAAVMVLYSVKQSILQSDAAHPYGRGRMEYFSAGLEGGLIGLAGILILYEAIGQLITGNLPHNLDQGIFLVATAAALNAALGYYLIRQGKQHHSPALVADGQHVMTDVVTSIGLLVGLLVVYLTQLHWLDAAIACAIGLWIFWSGARILRSSYHSLMDRVSPAVLKEVTRQMEQNRQPELIYPHRLRLREAGPKILLDFHCIIPNYLTIADLHRLETSFARALEKSLKRPVDLMLHSDPCEPQNCSICSMQNCAIRQSPQKNPPDWKTDDLLQDINHSFE